jgi:HAE1 family hydrophobic/amphiphilic exporter-1
VSRFDLFIRRPILTWMLMLSLLVFGMLGYQRLGVDQFPNLDFPVVTVQAALEGASPEVVEQDVTDVLEEYLNTIAGVRTIKSETSHGTTLISVEFELGVDIDVAAQDVRDKVAQARFRLPEDVEPPVVLKEDFSDEPVLWMPIQSDRPVVEASEYVRHHIKPRVETVGGVASVVLFGRRDRAIRIWLNGEELRARGLSAGDVIAAIQREHVEVPGGRVESHRVEYTVKTDAEFRTVEALERLIVAWVDGAPVRLKDVGRVEDGAEDPTTLAHFDGAPTVGIGIRKQSGANTVAVVDEVYRRVDEMRAELPTGFSFKEDEASADFSKSIRESVAETQFALIFGALLAILTVLVFLRRTRPTLIVAAAIPISLISTFGVMWLLGYTLNTMTLLAMALAVGVVIDDAIVVLENIERRREEGEAPREAASRGTAQIAFAATAATVSIAVVFLPVVFVEGIVGSFLREFGVTVASAVLVSLVVALTLTPMLAARMAPPKERAHGSLYHRLEQGFAWLERSYRRALALALSHRWQTLIRVLPAGGQGPLRRALQHARGQHPGDDPGVPAAQRGVDAGTAGARRALRRGRHRPPPGRGELQPGDDVRDPEEPAGAGSLRPGAGEGDAPLPRHDPGPGRPRPRSLQHDRLRRRRLRVRDPRERGPPRARRDLGRVHGPAHRPGRLCRPGQVAQARPPRGAGGAGPGQGGGPGRRRALAGHHGAGHDRWPRRRDLQGGGAALRHPRAPGGAG